MKWLLLIFTPIGCVILLALPIWASFNPWDEAKEKLDEAYPEVTAIQIAGGSSEHWSLGNKFESRSATYILFPHVFSSFKAVTFTEEKNDGILKGEIVESSGVLIWMVFFNTALILTTIFWTIPTIRTAIRNRIR
jgi:hypothetical protein